MKVAIKVCFWKFAGENGKVLLPEIFCINKKRISPVDVFIIFYFSANNIQMRAMGRKQQHYKKLDHIR